MEAIDKKLARAWSLENIYQHKKEVENLTYIGSKICEARIYHVYEDADSDIWYETNYLDVATGEVMTEEEKIFGRKISGKRYA